MDTRTITDPHPRTTRNESITRWSRRARLTLGVITFSLVAFFAAAAVALVVVWTPAVHTVSPAASMLSVMLYIATIALFLLMLFYLSFAAQNPRSENRGLWITGMVLLPWGILPVYWWAHVWNAPYVSDPDHDYNVPGGQLTPQAD